MNAALLMLGIFSNAGASVLVKLASAPDGGVIATLLRPTLWGG